MHRSALAGGMWSNDEFGDEEKCPVENTSITTGLFLWRRVELREGLISSVMGEVGVVDLMVVGVVTLSWAIPPLKISLTGAMWPSG